MKEKYSYLSKNILLFMISGFVPKILTFLLVPIYTRYLTTEEYGISDLISTTVSLLLPIFTLDIQDAVMRFAMDKNYNQKDVFSIAFKIISMGFIIILVGVIVISQTNLIKLKSSYLFFFCIMYLTSAINNSVSLFCRGIDKVKVMVVSGILYSIVSVISNIVFLVYLKLGLIGYLIANSLGAVISLVWCFIGANLFSYLKLRTSRKTLKEMLIYSFPLIFSVLSWWINNASDRYILSWMSGVGIMGLYAVAYKIPSILSVFQNIFIQAWSISAIKDFDKNDTDGFIGNMYTMVNFSMILLCSIIMIGNMIIAKILYLNEFFEAWRFVPPLLISVVFNAMALFIGSIFTAVKDTMTLSVSTILGAIVNVICNFIFIYFFGGYGAAFATLIGFMVTLIMRNIILKKYIDMKINRKRDFVAYLLLFIQMFIANLGWKGLTIQIIPFIIILFLYKKEVIQLFKTLSKILKVK